VSVANHGTASSATTKQHSAALLHPKVRWALARASLSAGLPKQECEQVLLEQVIMPKGRRGTEGNRGNAHPHLHPHPPRDSYDDHTELH
jgi:hypothetical protein